MPQCLSGRTLMPDVAAAGSVAGFTAEQVEEVRMVVRMFPIFLTTIFYWTIYSQVGPLHPPFGLSSATGRAHAAPISYSYHLSGSGLSVQEDFCGGLGGELSSLQ